MKSNNRIVSALALIALTAPSHEPLVPPQGFGVRQPSGAFGHRRLPKRQRAGALQDADATQCRCWRLWAVCAARALPLVLLLTLPAVVQAQYSYETNNSAITITGYNCSGGAVTIPSTITGLPVTSIGGGAFYYCPLLTSVTIPNSVTSIGLAAFGFCGSLTNVTIGSGVTSIGESAFYYSVRLTNITIPNSVTSIGYGAFERSGLTSVAIPNNVTNIGEGPFNSCHNLTAITVGAANSAYSSVNGVLFDKSQSTLIQYPAGKAGSDYTIPNSVLSIGGAAFAGCTSLTNVTIPTGVTNIGGGAFDYCTSLTSIAIPNSVTSIGVNAFYSCSSLTSVTIPNGVTSIGDHAFSGCTSLTSIAIPNSVTSIGGGSFTDCTGLASVTIGNSVTHIGNYAFTSCTNLTSVTIPNSVTSIGEGAFQDCSSLASVTIPNSVTQIRAYTFEQCISLTSITIPNSVTNIGVDAFYFCTGLTSVTIPASVISIGNYAFYGCTSLTSVTIGNSATSIGHDAFGFCTSLTSVTIGNGVTNIGEQAFISCTSLTAITVDALNFSYSSVDGVLFNKSQTTLIQYPGGKAGTYSIPNSVISIGNSAFAGCTSLTGVTIPDSVISIGVRAFWGCTSLTSVTIPNSVTSIENFAFFYCTSLTIVTLGAGVTSIGDQFTDCDSLTEVYFQGNAPSFTYFGARNATVYYLPGTTGWGPTYGGVPTALWSLPYPLILTSGPSFGVQTNQFGFIISWAANNDVVVEACTNLANPIWSPVGTNTLTDGWSYFSDPQWRSYRARFYRLRSP